MKIALICNTYIRNYGSILQSLASYKVLQNLGNEVKVVNYKDYPTSKAKMKIFWYVKLPLILNPITLIAKIKKEFRSKANPDFLKICRNREMSMDSFVVKHFDFTAACDSIEDAKNEIQKMDTVVVGSDQLWGPVDILRDYHTLSFLPESFKKVSYATSFGVAKLPEYVKPQASSFLKRFQYISVREDSGADIVEQAIGKRPFVVADPTLLLNGEQWSNLLGNERKVDEKYIFAFFLGGNKEHREFVKRVKAITGLPIVSMQHVDEYIDADENFADFNINDASPAEFVNLIKHAEFIFTDSFHASIFSIQFHKLFFTFDRYKKTSSNSRNGRIVSLFLHLNLNERHLLGNENVDELLSKKINYNLVDNILDEWRKNSIDYIKKALK